MIKDIRDYTSDSEYKKNTSIGREGDILIGHKHNYKVIYNINGVKVMKPLPKKLNINEPALHLPVKSLDNSQENDIAKGRDNIDYIVLKKGSLKIWKLYGAHLSVH